MYEKSGIVFLFISSAMAAINHVWEFRIRKSYVQLSRELQPSKILPELFQEEILDLDDMEEVNAEKTRKKRAAKLLKMILQSGKERALPVFVISLQKSHPRLAQLLHEPVPGENASSKYSFSNMSDFICEIRF